MRVLFTSLRNTSHFLPLVPFIEACRRRGADVGVAAPQDLAERVQATGATFFPFGHPGDVGLRPLWAKLRQVSKEEMSRIAVGEIFAGACARSAMPELLQTMDRFRPSVVVREAQEYAGLIAAEKAGATHAKVEITARGFGTEFFPIASEALDALRAPLGLAPDPNGLALQNEPALSLFPASFEGASAAPHRVLRFKASRRTAAPLSDYWPGREGPFVYLTLGTVMGGMDESRAAYDMALEAVRGLPIRVLLTVGNDLPIEKLTVPENVHVERFVPQDDVIPHAAVVIGHGGSGTTLGTLAAGVPLVVVPMFADQPHNGERVHAIGAGLNVPREGRTAESIRAAVTRVLAEPSFREAAQKVALEMAALPPTDEAAAALEQLVSRG